jgi:alpha-tubulin suppressor-like RCC1 family protein
MNNTSPRTSPLRWLLALLLGAGLLALTPARADAAPLTGITDIDGLGSTTCVVTSNHQARCWGEGSSGQIGNGSFSDASAPNVVRNVADTGPLTNVVQVTAGGQHACALLSTGRAVCWGEDGLGALGNGGSAVDSPTPMFVRNAADTAALGGIAEISAGGSTTCARLVSGQARCWGNDSEGQVGDAGPFEFSIQLPHLVARNADHAPLTGITQLSSGASHTCARLNTGQARCWGLGTTGQLGDDTNTNRNFAVTVKNGSGVAPLADIAQVAAGGNTSCARLSNGQARCWGAGDQGQIGNNDDANRARPAVVRAPAGPDVLRNVSQIAVSTTHTCFRLTNGQARCTGNGSQGALGNPNFSDGPVLRPVVVRNGNDTGALTGVAELAIGTNFSCARLSIGQARCWGTDINKQLGNGDAGGSEVPVAVIAI